MRARSNLFSAALGALALARLALPGFGQGALIHSFSGANAGDRLGWSVARVDDVDGDGVPDVALGVPFGAGSSVQVGWAELRSGASGTLLRVLDGDAALDHAGWALAGLGDLDGDGRGDLALGLPDSDATFMDAGLARVVSGASGATLFEVGGAAQGESFGWALCSAGDVSGDGRDDLIVGAWRSNAGGVLSGRVELRSGASGVLVRIHNGPFAGAQFGVAACGLSDVDGDGRSDYAIGADEGGQGTGFVRVYSGASGFLIRQHTGAASGARFGAALARVGDVDGDGRAELAVGAPAANAGAGEVRVYSGASGALLRTWPGALAGAGFGSALCGGFDLDADGAGDLLIGAPLAGAGQAFVLSGASGALLRTFSGALGGDRCGQAVAAAGDVDGDVLADFTVASPRSDDLALDGGGVHVLSGDAGACAIATYCTAKANSLGCLPAVSWSGSTSLSGPDDFQVRATHVLKKKPGVLLHGLQAGSIAFQGGVLCLTPPMKRSPTLNSGGVLPDDCTGLFAYAMTHALFSSYGWGAGATVHAQFWSRDPLQPDGTGTSLSNALSFVLCP